MKYIIIQGAGGNGVYIYIYIYIFIYLFTGIHFEAVL